MLRPGNGIAETHVELLLSVGGELQLWGQILLSCQNFEVSATLSLNCLFVLTLGSVNLCEQNLFLPSVCILCHSWLFILLDLLKIIF